MSKERYLAEAFLGFVVALLAAHLLKKLIAFKLVVNIGLPSLPGIELIPHPTCGVDAARPSRGVDRMNP
jgi:hypothetical protein